MVEVNQQGIAIKAIKIHIKTDILINAYSCSSQEKRSRVMFILCFKSKRNRFCKYVFVFIPSNGLHLIIALLDDGVANGWRDD